jgi:hypothetical protein
MATATQTRGGDASHRLARTILMATVAFGYVKAEAAPPYAPASSVPRSAPAVRRYRRPAAAMLRIAWRAPP